MRNKTNKSKNIRENRRKLEVQELEQIEDIVKMIKEAILVMYEDSMVYILLNDGVMFVEYRELVQYEK